MFVDVACDATSSSYFYVCKPHSLFNPSKHSHSRTSPSIRGLNWGGSCRISDPAPLIWDPLPLIRDHVPHSWNPALFCWDPSLCWEESKHQTLFKCHKSQTKRLWMLENPWSAVGNTNSALDPLGSSFVPSSLVPIGTHHLLLSNLTTASILIFCYW